MLKENNPYYMKFLTTVERQRANPTEQFAVRLPNPTDTGKDAKRYNLPTADEVGAIIYAKNSTSFEE